MQLPGNRVQLLPLWLREINTKKCEISIDNRMGECYTAIV